MSDYSQANIWLEKTGASKVVANKPLAKRIATGLLRGWRKYIKTGRCPWTGEELYDYTYFLHAFAQHYAGTDDELYSWLTENGYKMMDIIFNQDNSSPNRFCPVCGRILTTANTAKAEDGGQAFQGRLWCKKCASSSGLSKFLCSS